jgi:DNA-binding FrmR family transcriptional regulator
MQTSQLTNVLLDFAPRPSQAEVEQATGVIIKLVQEAEECESVAELLAAIRTAAGADSIITRRIESQLATYSRKEQVTN